LSLAHSAVNFKYRSFPQYIKHAAILHYASERP